MGRIFDTTLPCGCMLSSDGGGALIPCHYDSPDTPPEQIELCRKSWDEFKSSDRQKQFDEECERQNQ
jgi:hypothetical protein